jgi:hypothetical protein
MKKFYLYLLLLVSPFAFAQIKGIVTDSNNQPIPYANIYIEGTYIGTASNEHGRYELNYTTTKTVTILFQSLGYKT